MSLVEKESVVTVVIGGCLVVLASAAVYGVTLHPSVSGGDSGELMCVAHELGTPHPPGYPTFAFTTKCAEVIIRSLFPWLSVGLAQNIFHAFLSVCSLLFLYAATVFGGGGVAGGLIAAFFFGFAPNVWTYAIVTEVFPLNNFFICLLVLLAVLFWRQQSAQGKSGKALLFFSCFACGLSLTNQHTSVLFVSPIVIWVTAVDPSLLTCWRTFFTATCLFFLGLAPYAYLPLSSTFVISSNSWGNCNTLDGFVTHFFRKEYGTFSLASKESTYRVQNFFRTWRYFVKDMGDQTMGFGWLLAGVPIVLAVGRAGQAVYAILKRKSEMKSARNLSRRGAPRDEVAPELKPAILHVHCILLITWLLYCTFFNYLSNLPIERPLFYGVQQRFWIQPLIITALFMGVGFNQLYSTVQSRLAQKGSSRAISNWPKIVLAIALCIMQVAAHYNTQNEHDNFFVRDFGKAILKPLPQNAILLTKGDIMINSARFVQVTEQFRKDITILDQELLTFEWYNNNVKKQFPDITFPGKYYYPSRSNTYTIDMFLKKNRKKGRRVFLAVGWKEGDPSVEGKWQTVPYGLSQEVVSVRDHESYTKPSSQEQMKVLLKYTEELLTVLPEITIDSFGRELNVPLHRLPRPGKYPEQAWEQVVSHDLQVALVNVGHQLLTAIELGPKNSELPMKNLPSFKDCVVRARSNRTEFVADKQLPLLLKAGVIARNMHADAMNATLFDISKLAWYTRRNHGVVVQSLMRFLPNDPDLVDEIYATFSQHFDEAQNQMSDADKANIKNAIEYYKNLKQDLIEKRRTAL